MIDGEARDEASTEAPRASSAEPRDDASRMGAAAAWITTSVAALLLVTKLYAHAGAATLFDDAFMFQRYANNFLHGRGVRWNPSGEPTYGLTSLATLLVSVPARLVAGAGRPAVAALLTSLVPGLAVLVLTGWLIHRAPRVSRGARLAVLMTAMTMLALGHGTTHFLSGMDTMLALAYLAAYLAFASSVESGPSTRRGVLLGLFGGMALAVRPELGLLTVLLPLAQSFAPRAELRRASRAALGATLATLGAHLLLARVYFHSALPLPFYAKALGLYGPTMRRQYRGRGSLELVTFIVDHWPLFAIIALDIARSARRYIRDTSTLEKATLGSALLLLGYEWLFVLPIMYYDQRFYQPLLPALVFVAVRAAGRLEAAWKRRSLASLVPLSVVLGFALVPAFATVGQDAVRIASAEGRPSRFDMRLFALSPGVQKNLFRPDAFAALPDDVVIASSEVGLLGAIAPKKTIIDLAGLNDPAIVKQGLSAARVFEGGGPDVLYLPHPDYREFIIDLLSAPEIRGYELYAPGSLGTIIGLGIKRSSPHFARMKELVSARQPVSADQYDPSMKLPARP